MNTEEVTEAVAAENGAKYLVEVWESEVIGHCQDSDHHGTHIALDSS